MSSKVTIKQKLQNRFKKNKTVCEYIYAFFMLAFSAFIFAFGFRTFVAPATTEGNDVLTLATGGMSGVAQIFVRLTELIIGKNLTASDMNTFQSIYYLILNVPVIILAYKGIGKRFAAFTIFNVVLSSVFMKVIPQDVSEVFETIAHDNLTRAIFAGICTGLSGAFALMVDGSAGGVDVISYYFAIKKSTSVGKYTMLFNGITISIFTLLSYLPTNAESDYNQGVWVVLIYAIVYLFIVSLVMDQLSRRNKKAQIQIITTKEELPKILLSNFKHGCTVADAKGAFSGEGKKIVYIVVSSFEVKSVIRVVQEYDPSAFINVMSVQSLYGKFHIEPIK